MTTEPVLFIFARGRESDAIQVWPMSAPTPSPTVTEAQEYIFELRNLEDIWSVDLFVDDVPADALKPRDPTTARWGWKPGFYAGGVDLSIRFRGGRTVSFELTTDPDRRKLTRSDFDQMVREVLEDTFALFSLSSHRVGIARGTGATPPLSRLQFLRSRLTALEQVIARIAGRPVRTLTVDEQWLPLHKVRSLTGPEVARSLRTGRIAGFLPRQMRSLEEQDVPFPLKIRKAIKTVGLNIREHQEIKAALKSWSSWMTAIADKLAAAVRTDDPEQRPIRQAWVRRCRAMSARLDRLLDLSLFAGITDRPIPVVTSSIYQRVPAYNEFFRLHHDLTLGIAQVVGDFLQMPLARTFELYELWCFLRLLRAASGHFDIDPDALAGVFTRRPDGSIAVPASAVEVDLGNGYALAFQRTYREFWFEEDHRGSFSRDMRPDVSLTATRQKDGEDRPKLIVLDAKYRVGEQLNDAIASIHMYRDALVEPVGAGDVRRLVCGAYLLTPFEPVLSEDWKRMGLKDRLFHPAYRTTFRFGAATLKPGMTAEAVWSVLHAILTDAGIAVE